MKSREWIIQRCTQKWIGSELQYEDFPIAQGLMTHRQMMRALERVQRLRPNDEFRGHNIAPWAPDTSKRDQAVKL
jgi:hypothetical protein